MTKTRRAGFRKKSRRGGRKTVKRRGGRRRSRVTKRRGGSAADFRGYHQPGSNKSAKKSRANRIINWAIKWRSRNPM